ncbi:MAG TPA: hypothetical protein VH083_03415 [Myxococcales bacterium]|nr:hypothetical protein [Myxococcales bacterium]
MRLLLLLLFATTGCLFPGWPTCMGATSSCSAGAQGACTSDDRCAGTFSCVQGECVSHGPSSGPPAAVQAGKR